MSESWQDDPELAQIAELLKVAASQPPPLEEDRTWWMINAKMWEDDSRPESPPL